MRYPAFLPDGGTIGFVAPSFGVANEPYISRFDEALKLFNAKGYKTILGPNCRLSDGIGKSTAAEACGEEINDFLLSRDCDIIISVSGGETMCEDLPYIDFETIAEADPKWYLGYSDNTNLVFTLPTLCDTAAVYGPTATTFGMHPWHDSLNDTFGILTGRKLNVSNYDSWEKFTKRDESNPLTPYNTTEPFEMKVFNAAPEGHFSGRLIGGCLDCLVCLCGTPFDKAHAFAEKYGSEGIIWFIESCDLTPMGIRRALWQMDKNGWFDNVSAFMIGRPLHFDDEQYGDDRISSVLSVLDKFNVPVLMDLDIGHLPPMMPLISGSHAEIDYSENSICVDMQLI